VSPQTHYFSPKAQTQKKQYNSNLEKTKKKCTYCEWDGHEISECFRKQRSKPSGGKSSQQTKGQKHNKSEKSMAKVHTVTDQLWTATDVGIPKDWDFYLDCACSAHVTGRRDVFLNFTPIPEGTQPVKEFEGSVLHPHGRGSIKLTMRLPNETCKVVTIRNVLYVPGSVNLISQGILMELGLRIVAVNGYGINIYDKDNCLVARAPQVARMFPFDLKWPNIASEMISFSTLSAFKVTGQANGGESQLQLWYYRIAHLGLDSLKVLPSLVYGIPTLHGKCDCNSCIMGKHAHRPFSPLINKRVTEQLELIHSNICGPIPVASFGGASYMLLFIDDATRFTSIYIIKRKCDVLDRFKEYQAEMEKQTGKRIKCLRTDGGGEYTSKQFENFLKQEGILKETTAPYSPPSNGVVERANRTIMERARCMLDDACLSNRYWAEAVSTAVYLKNFSPTKALKKIPYEA